MLAGDEYGVNINDVQCSPLVTFFFKLETFQNKKILEVLYRLFLHIFQNKTKIETKIRGRKPNRIKFSHDHCATIF